MHKTIILVIILYVSFVVSKIHIPNSVKKMTIYYNPQILSNLPNYLEELYIGGNLNNTYQFNKLPPFIKKLTISNNHFDQSLDNLPKYLEELTINSERFNQPLDTLPYYLKKLSIHGGLYSCKTGFNQPLNNLPPYLEVLYLFAPRFNHSLNSLPNHLIELYINSVDFNIPIYNLPNGLLKFTWHIKENNLIELPDKLIELILI